MAASQPFAFPCGGGLDKSSSPLEMLQKPGSATLLENFEVDVQGGLHVYADGVIACSGTNIYFSLDGESWLLINRASVSASGDTTVHLQDVALQQELLKV